MKNDVNQPNINTSEADSINRIRYDYSLFLDSATRGYEEKETYVDS